MENKIMVTNLTNTTPTKIGKIINGNSMIALFIGDLISYVEINQTGYYCYGSDLPNNVSIYKKNYDFIIVRENNTIQNTNTICIQTISNNNYTSEIINDYQENVDLSGYTKLNKLNQSPLYKHDESTALVSGGTTTQYTSRLQRLQYTAQSSIIIISCRNQNGVGGSGVYFMSRLNAGSIENFTLTPISTSGSIDQFNLTGNGNGFTIYNSAGYRWYVTEISC